MLGWALFVVWALLIASMPRGCTGTSAPSPQHDRIPDLAQPRRRAAVVTFGLFLLVLLSGGFSRV
jgi:hypothetical protein